MTNDWLPGVAEITEWATDGALLRGGNYFRESRVEITGMSASRLMGKAHGSETYGLWLQRDGDEWSWHCDCPAAADAAFCKHLVAAVMTALDEDGGVRGGKARVKAAKPKKADELLAFLQAQPAERLAGWLHEFAGENRDIEKRLLLYRAAEQPGTLKAALGKLLATGGFLDYHRAIGYARQLDQVIEQLGDVLPRDPAACRELCEYVLKRVIKVYAERSDDSAGAIGECLHAIADLHARACAAVPPGKALAKTLFDLECIDG